MYDHCVRCRHAGTAYIHHSTQSQSPAALCPCAEYVSAVLLLAALVPASPAQSRRHSRPHTAVHACTCTPPSSLSALASRLTSRGYMHETLSSPRDPAERSALWPGLPRRPTHQTPQSHSVLPACNQRRQVLKRGRSDAAVRSPPQAGAAYCKVRRRSPRKAQGRHLPHPHPHTHTHTPTVTRTEASRAATPSHASSMRFYSPLAMCGVAAFSLCHARLLSFKTSRGRGAAGSLTFSQVCAVRFLCASFYGLRSTPTPTHFQRITTPACAANPVRLSAAKRPRP